MTGPKDGCGWGEMGRRKGRCKNVTTALFSAATLDIFLRPCISLLVLGYSVCRGRSGMGCLQWRRNTGDSSSQKGLAIRSCLPSPPAASEPCQGRYIPRAILHEVGVVSLAQLTHHTPGPLMGGYRQGWGGGAQAGGEAGGYASVNSESC